MEETLRVNVTQRTICRTIRIIMWIMAGVFLLWEVSVFAVHPGMSQNRWKKLPGEKMCHEVDMPVSHSIVDVRGISDNVKKKAVIQSDLSSETVPEMKEVESTPEMPVVRKEEITKEKDLTVEVVDSIPDAVSDEVLNEVSNEVSDKVSDENSRVKITEEALEINGFLIDAEGYITGYTDSLSVADGILVLPGDERCAGIRASAVEGLESMIFEIYIPANIIMIEPELFEKLNELMYIEVAVDNSVYFSENGVLYTKEGELIAFPKGRF